jgi:primosomal protein N' (replication factor Y)
VRGRFRYRLLIKAPRNYDLSHFMRGWLEHAPKTRKSLKLEVDIDPQSFY